ncbi:TerB N-terminal domain-containing protein [Pseudomonas sp.]|uniref:tellurite resistance TerB family protein n=1 Tax=Pseudomonas sp. TaxID=306 RepID=UPI0032664D91
MSRKKGNTQVSVAATMAVIVVVAIVIPTRWWMSIATFAAIFAVLWLVMASSRKRAHLKQTNYSHRSLKARPLTEETSKSEQSLNLSSANGGDSEFHTFKINSTEPQFAIPKSKELSSNVRWIRADESITVNGHLIEGGMLYFTENSGRPAASDPSLIDGQLSIQKSHVDIAEKLTSYWPSYSTISPAARRGYVQWLSGGRNGYPVDVGYVFIFFYGLERRALIDAITDEVARSELPAIIEEVKRLRTLYGDNASFRGYASNLISHIQTMNVEPQMYLKAPPRIDSNGFELPMGLRVALGQMASDQYPLNSSWALAWALSDPNISRRTAVGRCADQFEHLFKAEYSARYPRGIVLGQNKTLLKIAYRSASSRLSVPNLALGDLPDVTVTSATRNKLQAIVDECALVLDPYSRYLGRNPEGASDLEGILQLPVALWPAAAKDEVTNLKLKVGDDHLVMTFGELAGRFKSAGTLSRGKIVAMARAFESLNIGLEPDVLSGSRTPRNSDTIVLFATEDADGSLRTTADYDAAVVTLDLASAVAAADGETSVEEMTQLGMHIDAWDHLCMAHRKRLKAHLQIQILQPPTLASLKKKLGPLSLDAKRSIAGFLSHLAQVDGNVSAQEIRLLERVYKALELDPKLVYADLHGAAVSGPNISSTSSSIYSDSGQTRGSSSGGREVAAFNLDMGKIAQLQRETAVVSALLAEVFSDETTESTDVLEASVDEPAENATTVYGLDTEHSAFLRLLVSRREWSRQELEDVASDMELMLDGALEQINDMAFERFDLPISEGDDPIEINPDILEELAL